MRMHDCCSSISQQEYYSKAIIHALAAISTKVSHRKLAPTIINHAVVRASTVLLYKSVIS